MNAPVVMPGTAPGRRPRLRRGLAVVTTPDGLLVEGGPSRQLLGGASSSLLPSLLPYIDGTRALEQIAADLSLGGSQLGQVLSLLDGCGLLEWVQPDGPAGFAADHVATYMSRTMGITGPCPSADDLAGRLESATVVLVAPPVLADLIAGDLKETGVGTVHLCTAAQAGRLAIRQAGHYVAAVFDDSADESVLATAVAAAHEHDLPVLRFSATAGYVEVGPIFCAGETACVPCFRRGQALATDVPAESWAADAGAAGLLAGLVTSGLLGMLTRQAPVPSPWGLARTTIPLHVTQAYDVIPELECASCTGGTPPQDPVARAVLAYEWRMAKVPASLEPVSVPIPAERDWLIALQRQRESFPSSPCHRLPDQSDAAGPAGGLDESVLAAILARTVGFRAAADPQAGRWAPSGGNMASVAAYVCTEADLFSLPGTIYRYDDNEHQVLSAHADQLSLGQILDGTDLDSKSTDIAIVLVGVAGRLRQKYGDFAWRLTHLDSGCAALQLALVAAGYGLRVTFASSWPGQLAELLELDPEREVVTAVAGISAAAGLSKKGSSPCR